MTVILPSLTFRLLNPPLASFSPRLGLISLPREDATKSLDVATPNFLSMTSRGSIPHLTRDSVEKTPVVGWVHVPFESFLEQKPPVPTLYPGPRPLHDFLGFPSDRHILSMSIRDWNDDRDIPPNGKDNLSAMTTRGVKQVTPSLWNSLVSSTRPDIAFAMSDIPITSTVPSERRGIKSIQKSLHWLSQLLRIPRSILPNVFVQLAGGWNEIARDDFATGLLEALEGSDARELGPLGLSSLDEGVCGYSIDLMPLRKHAPPELAEPSGESTDALTILTRLSLRPLPGGKIRLITGCNGPHDVLAFVAGCGADLFDSRFAQRAADWGVGLEFCFPAPTEENPKGRQREIGINLYDVEHNMSSCCISEYFSGTLDDASTASEGKARPPTCPCLSCSPCFSRTPLAHSSVDPRPEPSPNQARDYAPPFTRAYIHHLLTTHEMTAHVLLASHNLCVLDAFFTSIRSLLSSDPDRFEQEVRRFEAYYRRPDETGGVLERAKTQWEEVELERGKGRLTRVKTAKAQLLGDGDETPNELNDAAR